MVERSWDALEYDASASAPMLGRLIYRRASVAIEHENVVVTRSTGRSTAPLGRANISLARMAYGGGTTLHVSDPEDGTAIAISGPALFPDCDYGTSPDAPSSALTMHPAPFEELVREVLRAGEQARTALRGYREPPAERSDTILIIPRANEFGIGPAIATIGTVFGAIFATAAIGGLATRLFGDAALESMVLAIPVVSVGAMIYSSRRGAKLRGERALRIRVTGGEISFERMADGGVLERDVKIAPRRTRFDAGKAGTFAAVVVTFAGPRVVTLATDDTRHGWTEGSGEGPTPDLMLGGAQWRCVLQALGLADGAVFDAGRYEKVV